ncbi:SRPBCC family protein [Flavisolibacter ginsenosidimutans]|uniref:SRPBCC family protein n=1 Tax=Flavisolibacter ginsenosidimutans TaxID=661481 RepID=A0A5B8UFH0_9BACT|nr:SRPBCC family protein [Flavisolibacter ginsenosidimutans]QEC55407.1 SRPBCC family protein [Flavisolibacter ginsenosidimutans]
MKILKRIGLFLLGLIALILITALFVKKDLHAEREVVINKSKADVFNYVKYLKNQNDYSKWAGMDPAMKKEFRGTDGTVGFVSAWESKNKNVGKGEQKIAALKEGERIDYEIHFIKPMESMATSYMITEPVSENQTKVRWGFDSKMTYPFNVMRLFMDMDKMIGDDFNTGLSNLKSKLEK